MNLAEELQEMLKPYKGKYVLVSDLDMDVRSVNVALMDEPKMFEEVHLHGKRYVKCIVKPKAKKKIKSSE
jgi:ADP-dependent phosphofructokinase/glucokinase